MLVVADLENAEMSQLAKIFFLTEFLFLFSVRECVRVCSGCMGVATEAGG